MIKETCQQCSALDHCVGVIEKNIHSLLLPVKKETVKCDNFKHLSNYIIDIVAQHFAEAINKGE